jgi:polysaccharide export outer membrane protein
MVDAQGNIQVPQLGALKVAGLTTQELKDQMTQSLVTYLKQPLVNIRILNFKISVMGDVARPNVYTVDNERITLPEALTLAGDLNITAKRNILLIRENAGKREFIPIDLTSKKFFDSQYYYLKNNDVIYVDPDKTKFETVDNSYRNAELVLSAVSALSLIATLVLFHNR